ncbi:crossover junction endodeoxyribonuclease RuvC [Candidatus Absconditicoccus praedator]|uniref:crossover junction endodeoxyribonuclease RuvC n=1 Tax=Candidatus Absconditicoccus praedator TaxID=2735562 RepID=UPI001E3BC0D4|nr:crossover junction endodeoxyribonuclease RuvC [Candidatus Absconditicoccus praedator]UFX82682.1 crossover junction endodeoxyribonuclease RuvC [Candidatus Absconditicoccus praedator]
MILGIDPGVRKLGYSLIDKNLNINDAGILLLDQKGPQRLDQFTRILKIYEFFEDIVNNYEINKVGIEKLYFTKFNQSNAEFVYGIRGALISMFIKKEIKIIEYTPIQLKKYITGNSKANKILVQQIIMKIYGLEEMPEYDDAADALGLAYLAMRQN